jgi:pimeloyl-ACP methyl ester carboxylesterase
MPTDFVPHSPARATSSPVDSGKPTRRIDDDGAEAFIAALDEMAQRHEVAFAGGRVCWRRFGAGPALVLLHGGHGCWLHWARNIRAWSSRYTVWVPDLPGYGDSDSPPEASLASLVDATRDTLDTLVGSATPIALVGFSFGALVASHLAARRGSVPRLALFGPGGHGGTRRPRGELHSWREAAERGDDAELARLMAHNLLMHMLHDAESVDALALRIHTEACLRTRFRSKAISLAGGLARALDLHHGALLLAWGEHDVTAIPEQAALSLSRGRDRCRTHVVAGAGHWVQYERADEVNRLLLAWLDETSSQDPES